MRISDWSSDVCSSDLRWPWIGTTPRHSAVQRRRLDQLDPVAVGILDEGDVAHAAVAELLLARYAPRFHPRAGGAHVGQADADVAEAARFAVAVRSEERRVGQEWVRTGRSRGWQIH